MDFDGARYWLEDSKKEKENKAGDENNSMMVDSECEQRLPTHFDTDMVSNFSDGEE